MGATCFIEVNSGGASTIMNLKIPFPSQVDKNGALTKFVAVIGLPNSSANSASLAQHNVWAQCPCVLIKVII